MSDTDKLFAGSIPENYDRYMVPLIFEGFAEDLARRVVRRVEALGATAAAVPQN